MQTNKQGQPLNNGSQQTYSSMGKQDKKQADRACEGEHGFHVQMREWN